MPPLACHRARSIAPAFGVLALLISVGPAHADTFGIGPRFSFVRGSADAETSTRYSGALLRARLSPKTAVELSLDYRSVINDSLTERIRNYPIQGSLLLYLTRSAVSPYLLGGIGWYSQKIDNMAGDEVTASTTTRRVGSHAGVGGELRLGRHAAVHVDYRYTFIHFGDQEDTATSGGAVPLPGTVGLQQKLKLSHEGSMWTTGLTVYF